MHQDLRWQNAFFRNFYGDYYDVYSAGSEPKEIHSIAVKVMAEIGIDISTHTSNSLKDYEGQEFDFVEGRIKMRILNGLKSSYIHYYILFYFILFYFIFK